jgi:Arc/MetJ-type ribon-helix-helix transcriptional regulator
MCYICHQIWKVGMANRDALILTLPEPFASEVKRAVKEGGYSEPEDVVAAALSDWIARGRPPAMTAARLRELVEEAERSGEEVGDFDVESLIKELHSKSTKS